MSKTNVQDRPDQKRHMETEVATKSRTRHQRTNTVQAPDAGTMEENVLYPVQAGDEAKAYVRIGNKVFEVGLTEVEN